MMLLFRMECKKIIKSILYWAVVLVFLAVSLFGYEPAVERELRRASDPASIFYTASSGGYAEEQGGVTNETMEQAMMTGATSRLISNYRENCYLYYPFGYVKEKTMSEKEQALILQYLMELTGLSEEALNETADGIGGASVGDIPISGSDAFILEPGKGSTDKDGKFVAEPDDWQYVPGDGTSSETASQADNSFEIQVPFERFKKIMEEVDRLIGRNSYFSDAMLTLYYSVNDMEDAPITERQHWEFYEGDRVTGAFARYYCDSISLVVLFLPALVVIELMLRDKRRKMQGLTYSRSIASAKVICIRYAAAVFMVMLPILILPVKSLVTLMQYCGSIGVQVDVFAFAKYILAWIAPTVLLVMALGLLVTVLLENYTAILLVGLVWLVGRPSAGKLAGGNYGPFDLIIRHNTLKGYGRMMENIQMLVLNRTIISAVALALVGVSIMVYSMKRKGGLSFGGQKPVRNHRFKFTPEH